MLDIELSLWWLSLEIVVFASGLTLALFFVADVLKQRRAPASTAAWLLALVLLPYIGVLLYLLFSARKLDRPRGRLGRLPRLSSDQVSDGNAHPLDSLLRGLGLSGASTGNHVLIHSSPEHAHKALLELIAGAQQRIVVDLYSYEDDPSTRAIMQAIIERAKAGIAVYMLIDDIGSVYLRLKLGRELQRVGVRLVRFKPLSQLTRIRILNLRNHRKIMVADGKIAWTGGRNWGKHYFSSLQTSDAWQDLSCTVQGHAAQQLEEVAWSDWRFATGERPKYALNEHTGEKSAETPSLTASVQVVPSGPDLRDDTWHAALLAACFLAKRRLWLATPYFVPDEALQNALLLAARRGIDLRIIVPQRSDNRLVDWVRMPYLRELALCGARIQRYQPRMLHAKAMLMDDSCAALGTANLDARSLFLNYEVMLLFYGHAEIFAVGDFLNGVQADCHSELRRVGWLVETLTAPLRLFAPLL